jgi:hypothetical protein
MVVRQWAVVQLLTQRVRQARDDVGAALAAVWGEHPDLMLRDMRRLRLRPLTRKGPDRLTLYSFTPSLVCQLGRSLDILCPPFVHVPVCARPRAPVPTSRSRARAGGRGVAGG